MLKKQTVWLLTMLSLMIVLSVYYMMSPNGGDFAYLNQDAENNEQTTVTDDADADADSNAEDATDELTELEEVLDLESEEATVTSSTASDELFAAIRMERDDQRGQLIEQLEGVMASSSTSTDEKDKAYEEMAQIQSMKTKEYVVEQTLKSENNYPDVLVRADGDGVIVTVKTDDELSREEANNIVRRTSDEFGEVDIKVKYQPVNTSENS